MYFLLLRKKGGARETYSEGGTYRVVKRKGKTQLERPRRKWEENIKINVQEIVSCN
jgi:hypothetical protein